MRNDPPETTWTLEQIREGILQAAGRGDKLDPPIQRRLERSLGADLSGVRVHTDNHADKLARAVGAAAFTSGSDIFFRSGAYNPGSSDGLFMLAHEAAHVMQQTSGAIPARPTSTGISINPSNSPHEFAADCAAERVLLDIPAAGDALSDAAYAHTDRPQVAIQRHASWEHRLLGDAKPADLNAIAKKLSNRQQLLQTELQFLGMWMNNTMSPPTRFMPSIRTCAP
jgi:hypothetical protein